MKMILLGAPGAGKGTQAELLVKQLSIPAISTGNMLREAMANGSELGQKVKNLMESGSLVPDDIILDIVEERISQPDCANGYILDGVPRTLVQAEALEARGVTVDHVVSLEIDDDVVVSRMAGRRVCSKCGASYHMVANPPKAEGICDGCAGSLVVRKDDAPETVLHRLSVYHQLTEPLKEFYRQQGKLRLIPGDSSIQEANRAILEAIGAKV